MAWPWDLARIARQSGVCIELDSIPVHRDAQRRARKTGKDPVEHALLDGEDHELIACLPRAAWERSQRKLRRRFPELVEIGLVRKGSGLLLSCDVPFVLPKELARLGWLHGKG